MYIAPMSSESNEIQMAPSNELPQQISTEDYGGFQLFARANIWITARLTNLYECS